MAATLDKDTLVKHSFWFLAGGYVLLVLGCLAVLATSVGDAVQKEAETLKKAEATVQGINNPQNQTVVDAFKKQDDLVDRKKEDVWKKAWETQKDMMTWPRALASRFQKYKYFGDQIGPYERSDFKQQYTDQFPELLEVVDPVGTNGEGVVQCKGGDWAAVLNLFDKDKFADPPSSADIWLAQEELWVKREMLRIIHDANQYVARFKEVTPESQATNGSKEAKAGAEKDAKPVKPDAAPAASTPKQPQPAPAAAKTDPNHKIFRNPYWELDLTLSEPTRGKFALRSKITNISRRKRALDTKFKIFLQDPRAVADPAFQPITIAGLPLAVGESKEGSFSVDSQKTIEGLFGVEQVLNWRTAPVKRLDDLQLMYNSSRTAVRTLKPPSPTAPAFKTDTPDAGGDSSGSGDASAQSATPVAGGASYGPATAQTPGTTLSGLTLDRYTDVSAAVRHMPVAMVVVVDEEDLPQLLAAFVNSKLRIQITQYHWHHCRDPLNPQLYNNEGGPQYTPSGPGFMARGGAFSGPSSGGPGMTIGGRQVAYGVRRDYPGRGGSQATRPGGPGMPYNPPGRPMAAGASGPMRSGPPRPMPSAGRTPVMPGPGGSGAFSEEDQEPEDLNLLEVAVYGLASLYERFPPRPQQPAAAEEKKPEAAAADSK